MKPKIVVANWKCNPETSLEAAKLFKLSDKKDVIVAPPFVFLSGASLSNAVLAAQDVFWGSGPFTGEISAIELAKLGVKYVIVGHSERRSNFGETDEIVSIKAKAALDAGLSVIICVGESTKDREEGTVSAERSVRRSVIGSLSGIPPKRSNKVIIAYEPIWAIGTGSADNPVGANERAVLIKSIAKGMGLFGIGVLYGGSVSKDNTLGFLSQPEIDGLLVGGASINADEFPKIILLLRRINGTPEESPDKNIPSSRRSEFTRRPSAIEAGKARQREKSSLMEKEKLSFSKSAPRKKNIGKSAVRRSPKKSSGSGSGKTKKKLPSSNRSSSRSPSLTRHSERSEKSRRTTAKSSPLKKRVKKSKK